MTQERRPGFTLIELMIVVAIIGLLSAIAIPKFANLAFKAREATLKSKLGAFRAAISLYYASTEGVYPQGEDALVPRFLDAIPAIGLPAPINHDTTDQVGNTLDDWATGRAWLYNGVTGVLAINCTHTDTKGMTWSTY